MKASIISDYLDFESDMEKSGRHLMDTALEISSSYREAITKYGTTKANKIYMTFLLGFINNPYCSIETVLSVLDSLQPYDIHDFIISQAKHSNDKRLRDLSILVKASKIIQLIQQHEEEDIVHALNEM